MTETYETLLLAIMWPLLLLFGVDTIRSWRRRRRESALLDRLDRSGSHDVATIREEPPGQLERQLKTLGLGIAPITYVIIAVLLTALGFFTVLDRFPNRPAVAFLVAAIVAYLCASLVRDLAVRRAHRFEAKLVDAIDLFVSALSGGENPTQALKSAADAQRGVVKQEFEELGTRLAVGMPIEQAVARMRELYDVEGTRLFTQTLIAKWGAGGELAPVLRSVNRIIRERLKLRLHLEAQLAGPRLSSMLVAAAPYLIIPVFLWRRPEWLQSLTAHPLGPTLLFLAVSLQIVGFVWIRRLFRIEF